MAVIGSQIDIGIDTKNVCRYLGYSSRSRPSARVLDLIDGYMENARSFIDPSYSYVIRNVKQVRQSYVLVDGPIVFQSVVIARLLRECSKVAVLVATIGSRLEEKVRQLARDGLMLQASVLDAVGSEAVEKVADLVQCAIEERANAEGLVSGRRFCPGYCDWDISQQPMVFRAVKGDSIGVHLTESCLMIPQKSISGIVGIGLSDGNLKDYNPCKACSKTDCLGRR
ncbi:MAG: vitamin B12 dependent-methionine synthase activation domain-containing protein [Dehalococcoidia bacterium]